MGRPGGELWRRQTRTAPGPAWPGRHFSQLLAIEPFAAFRECGKQGYSKVNFIGNCRIFRTFSQILWLFACFHSVLQLFAKHFCTFSQLLGNFSRVRKAVKSSAFRSFSPGKGTQGPWLCRGKLQIIGHLALARAMLFYRRQGPASWASGPGLPNCPKEIEDHYRRSSSVMAWRYRDTGRATPYTNMTELPRPWPASVEVM